MTNDGSADRRVEGSARPAGYEPPRIEAALSARDLEREVATGTVVISRADA